MIITHKIRQAIFDIFCGDTPEDTKVEFSVIPPIAELLSAKKKGTDINKQAKILLVMGTFCMLQGNSWEENLEGIMSDEALKKLGISEVMIKDIERISKIKNLINQ